MKPLRKAAEEAGVTYRQADHWQRRGYIRVVHETATGALVEQGGTGTRTMLGAEQEQQFRWMAALVHAGFTPSRAAQATQLLSHGGSVALSDELVLCHAPMLAHAAAALSEERRA